jgi:hypothetical protein
VAQGNTIQFKTPDGQLTEPIDLGGESPDSPKVRQFMASMLQKGFTPASGPEPVREPPAGPQPGTFEQMRGVGPTGLREAATGVLGSFISNTALAPLEGGQLQAGPMGREIAEGMVPSTEQQLMKESMLALTGFVGTPARVASKIGLGVARVLAPAFVDLVTGKDPNPVEMALVGMGELGSGAAKWTMNRKLGKQSIVNYERAAGDSLASDATNLLPDVKMGNKTSDLYHTFASETFGDSKAAQALGKQFDELDKVIDGAFKGQTIDLSSRPALAMAVSMYRKDLPGMTSRIVDTTTTTIQEARKAMHYTGDVAFDFSKAPGTVEHTATGASMRQLAEGAKVEYKGLVGQRVSPDALSRLEALDKQYGDSKLLHSVFSPALNKDMYHITAEGPRIKLEAAQQVMARSAELEKRGMGQISQTLSQGQAPGTGAEIGGLNTRVSGTPFGSGLAFMGGQLQIHTLKTPVTKAPRAFTGPVEAGLLRLLDASGWTKEGE